MGTVYHVQSLDALAIRKDSPSKKLVGMTKSAILNALFVVFLLQTMSTSSLEYDYEYSLDEQSFEPDFEPLKSKLAKSKFGLGFSEGFNNGRDDGTYCRDRLVKLIRVNCNKARKEIKLTVIENLRKRQRSGRKRIKKQTTSDQKHSRSKRANHLRENNEILNRLLDVCCYDKCRKEAEAQILTACRTEHKFQRWFLQTMFSNYRCNNPGCREK